LPCIETARDEIVAEFEYLCAIRLFVYTFQILVCISLVIGVCTEIMSIHTISFAVTDSVVQYGLPGYMIGLFTTPGWYCLQHLAGI